MLAVIFVYLSVKLCYDGRLIIVANEMELGKSKEFRAVDEPDVVKASADIAGMVAVVVLWIVENEIDDDPQNTGSVNDASTTSRTGLAPRKSWGDGPFQRAKLP